MYVVTYVMSCFQYDDVQKVHKNNESLQKLVEQLETDKVNVIFAYIVCKANKL